MPYRVLCKRFLEPPGRRLQKSFTQNSVWHQKKAYAADFKAKAVLESLQRDTTLEAVCRKFGASRSQLMRWRQEFQEKVPGLFVDKRNPK